MQHKSEGSLPHALYLLQNIARSTVFSLPKLFEEKLNEHESTIRPNAEVELRFNHLFLSAHCFGSRYFLNRDESLFALDVAMIAPQMSAMIRLSILEKTIDFQSGYLYDDLIKILKNLIVKNLDNLSHYQHFFKCLAAYDPPHTPDYLANLLNIMFVCNRTMHDERVKCLIECSIDYLQKKLKLKENNTNFNRQDERKLLVILTYFSIEVEYFDLIEKLIISYRNKYKREHNILNSIDNIRFMLKIIYIEFNGRLPPLLLKYQEEFDILFKDNEQNVTEILKNFERGHISLFQWLKKITKSKHPNRFKKFQEVLHKKRSNIQHLKATIEHVIARRFMKDSQESCEAFTIILFQHYLALNKTGDKNLPSLIDFLQYTITANWMLKTAWKDGKNNFIENIINFLRQIPSEDLLKAFHFYVISLEKLGKNPKIKYILIGLLFQLAERNIDFYLLEKSLVTLLKNLNKDISEDAALLLISSYYRHMLASYSLSEIPFHTLLLIAAKSLIVNIIPIIFKLFFLTVDHPTTESLLENNNYQLPSDVPIPFLLRLCLLPEDLQTYADFYYRFEKINQRADERYQVDFHYFIYDHLDKIYNLYQMVGRNTFSFLSGFLTTSALAIERFLNAYEICSSNHLIYMVKSLSSKFLTMSHTQRSDVLLLISMHQKILSNSFEAVKIGSLIPNESWSNFSETEVIMKVRKLLADSYCQMLGLTVTNEMDASQVLARIPTHLLAQLFVARNHMKCENYRQVFDSLLRIDLSPGLSFESFIREVDQTSDIGKSLATHNQNIIRKLSEAGINTDLAMRYPVTKEIIFAKESTYDFNQLLIEIWNDVMELKKIIEKLPPSKKVIDLTKNINNFINQVTRKQKSEINLDDIHFLEQIQNNLSLIGKILQVIAQLKQSLSEENNIESSIIVKNRFLEFSTHLQDHHMRLLTLTKENGNKKIKLIKPKCFTIQQWDKSQIETFFLGNYLSCCLATDGTAFHAIVQRRMDEAMLIFVGIDKDIGEPVFGNWLFFALDLITNKIYLVANYFEMRAGYSNRAQLRDFLIQSLCEFTAEFSAQIGVAGFLIRQLTYGLIPDFTDLEDVEVELEKVGGYLELDNDESSDTDYYLEAVYFSSLYTWPLPEKEKVKEKEKEKEKEMTQKSEASLSPLRTFTFLNQNEAASSSSHIKTNDRKPYNYFRQT